MRNNDVYPFSAIVGQDKLKKALLINIVNPSVGGVLISGEKGTGKSTLVRGLGNLIQDMEVIELPLNATEDMLIGSIDIEKALVEGKRTINNSILMKANGNILYVDEVNLLSEAIVNSLLEVSQSGISRVEREGITFMHESLFILVGTMNPEEGGLRPQFLDRFGLFVEVLGSDDLYERINIIERRIQYEENPSLFIQQWKYEDSKIWNKIKKARELISKIVVSESMMKVASEISMKANCSGHRGEIVMIEASKAIAALYGRKNITIDDLKEASQLALPHRMRDNPPDMSESDDIEKEDNNDANNEENNIDNNDQNTPENISDDMDNDQDDDGNDENRQNDNLDSIGDSDNETIDDIGNLFKVKDLDIKPLDRKRRKGAGRRSIVKTSELQGRYVRYTFPKGKYKDIAFDATLRAAAPYQDSRNKEGLALSIKKQDIREKIREKRTGSTILFVVDASGSMGAKKRMESVKGAIMSLLNDAYQKRDSVGMIAFRKEEAELILNITRSVDLAYKKLKDLPTGGKTPLTLGLYKGYEILKNAMKRNKDIIPVLVLVTDGRGNVSIGGKEPLEEALQVSKQISIEGIQTIVIDTEQDFIQLKLAEEIAKEMGADYHKLEELKAEEILNVVRNHI